MNYPENLSAAADLLKKAVPKMVAYKLPANPINYTLWYNYVCQRLPSLNQAIDQLIEKFGSYDDTQARQLYRQHIIADYLGHQQPPIDQINQWASQLLNQLQKSVEGSADFDASLQDSLQKLQQSQSLTDVQEVITKVIASTHAMSEANQQFKQQLNQASEEITALKNDLRQSQENADIDMLTQLYNRSAFNRQLEQLISNISMAENVCLILADIDHFKSFNDNYGHVIGDRVLQRMGELIADNCTDNAFGARYGGEEFAIIISNSDLAGATALAESIREKLNRIRVKIKKSDEVLKNISASFGVAQYQLGENLEDFIDRTDRALYVAKNNGRNRVEPAA